ncbi:MAG: ATP-dependent 6-phosphofructokinase [Anaerolineae bacterium]|nr:ATP-dependent 6-phosphofructokinase [Anaerolineae bacterium]
MKKIGVLTGGGDAPGLNAVIRAVVKTAVHDYDCEVLGIRNGFEGFLEQDGVIDLDLKAVSGILPRGGTILGAANRGNPFARKVERNGEIVIEDISAECIARAEELGMEALVVVGGDGTLHIAQEFNNRGVPTVGVPKTIDNDVGGTDFTFGFDTAVNIATEALDRLHTTAESHHRVMILELMGRDAGFIALHSGISGGADVILIPEIPFHFEAICRKVTERKESGRKFSILAVSEGAHPEGEQQVFRRAGDEVFVARLGGVGGTVATFVENVCQAEARVTVLGHLQRGGTPTAFDRWLATRYGAAAVRLIANKGFGRMVSLQQTTIVDVPFSEALAVPKRVDIGGDAVVTARGMGIAFGDEPAG